MEAGHAGRFDPLLLSHLQAWKPREANGFNVLCVIFTQGRFVVLPAIEDANDGHRLGIYIKGDDGTLLVIRDAQAWPHVITLCPTKGKRAQAFAVANDGLGILGRHI